MRERIAKYAIMAGIMICLLGSMTAESSAEQFLTVPVDLDAYDVSMFFNSQENIDRDWSTYPTHKGTDYNTGEGMPIRAAADGVAYLMKEAYSDGTLKGFGYYVDIKHGNGYWTRYAHLNETRRKSGTVERGDIIGYSSNTGAPWGPNRDWSGPHLHFEVRKGGQWGTAVDPYNSTNWLWIGNPPKQFAEVLEPPILFRYLNYEDLNDPYIDRIYEIKEDSQDNWYKNWIIHEQAFKEQWYYGIAEVVDVYINPSKSLWKEMILGENIVFKDGTLIENSGTIYEIQNGEKRGFTSWESYISHGYDENTPTVKVSDEVANAAPTGLVIDYKLMRADGYDEVYLIQGNEKKHIPDLATFDFWGFSWDDIQVVSKSEIDSYIDKGEIYRVRYGTFIGQESEGIKVYFVSVNENGDLVKRHIFNQDILAYLGGTSEDVYWLSDEEFNSIPEGVMYKPPEHSSPVIVDPPQDCQSCHSNDPTPPVIGNITGMCSRSGTAITIAWVTAG